MGKLSVKLNGQKVVIDTSRPKVAACVAALIEACAERQFNIGSYFSHVNGDDYQLVRIKQYNGVYRAYLINENTGKARNSTKVVMVQDARGGANGSGYVTDLPCEKDKFFDPENPGEFIDM